ncbi:MAG: hypothetical protein OIN66_13825 [Candidatus Methanoperedens sp.]|nr:hypothetical protein [Candidatus Methanoperedens sp.]
MKKLLIFVLIIGTILSGCIEEKPVQKQVIPASDNARDAGAREINSANVTPSADATGSSNSTGDVNSTDSINYSHSVPAATAKPTKFDSFVSWLKTDETNKHSYVIDNSKVYADQYVCSQFTKDFLKNATAAGFEVYAVGLTGAVRGQNEWHMLAAVVLDKDWYFVDPQTDEMLKKESMFNIYGYEYAYFGREVVIDRNNAKVNLAVSYHPVIGLNGQNFLYLR